MRLRRWNAVLVPVLLELAAISCGGADVDSIVEPNANISTGLPTDQKFSDFDDSDAKAACEALNDGASELISDAERLRSQCASRAITMTAELNTEKTLVTLDVAKCEKHAESCKADPATYGVADEGARDEQDCDKAVANQQVLSCDATVAEYEACVGKILVQVKQALGLITCANGKALYESDGAEIKLDPQRSSECQLFLGKCPDVQVTAAVAE